MTRHSVAEARSHLSDTEMATRDITTGAWHPERMDRTGATQRSRSPGDRREPHVVQMPTPPRPCRIDPAAPPESGAAPRDPPPGQQARPGRGAPGAKTT